MKQIHSLVDGEIIPQLGLHQKIEVAHGKPARNPLSLEIILKSLVKLQTLNKELSRQNRELSFAYQTLEVGYQRYWEFFNFAPDGYLVTDVEGTIKEANQTCLDMFSVSPPELLGKPVSQLIPDIDLSQFETGKDWRSGAGKFEVKFPVKGKLSEISISIAPQYNVNNKPVGFLWLIRDITEQKQIENALIANEARLKLILDQTPCILWTTNKELQITTAAGTGLSALNLLPGDIIGLKINEISGEAASAYLKALAGNPQTFEFEWKEHILHCTAEALKDSSGQITGVVGASFDITKRILIEKSLRKSQRFTAGLLEKSPNPIIVINHDTSISYINPALERLTGFSAKKLKGKKAPYPWWTGNNTASEMKYLKLLNGEKSAKRERLYQKKNGEPFWVEITSMRVKNEDEPDFYLETWVDITESKRLRENMDFYIMQINRIQEEERKRIAQEIHEEALQSLAALSLRTERIAESSPEASNEIHRELKEIQIKINEVIENLRRFSYDLRPGVLDYLGLTAALETLTEELSEQGIRTHLLISGEEVRLAAELEIALFRIAQEAVSNIRKYSRATRAYIKVSYLPGKVRLIIGDNGTGFNLPPNLSDFGTQGKLGIIGMEERVRLNGGVFSIKSAPEKGTRISVILPLSVKIQRN